jgi:hypothetical protein
MTTTTGNTHTGSPPGQGRTKHVLLRDDLGRLALVRLRPWHRLLARGAGWRLDGELAAGASPESSIRLAARAMQLTSSKSRRDLATSLERILAVVREQPAGIPAGTSAVRPPRLPLCRARISRSAGPLATLVGCLTAPGPVPVQGVAMVHRLVTNGTGPLYWQACRDDLGDIIEKATQALTR